ncbi:lactonase family protein [Phytohabitans houttuyneae]|uniref:lactonase family protein n=1 Tax=Phytohabitans houttuyneae TaxID=1076126 RepID=UPI001FE88377|nr:beta-propeller fold lactonase family protein [Phytohabitans houttuyneae]
MGGEGVGITAVRRDPATGRLDSLGVVAPTPSPSFLAWHPTLPVLYATNELDEGSVSAWAVQGETDLRPLGTSPTGGAHPCHLVVAPGGRYLSRAAAMCARMAAAARSGSRATIASTTRWCSCALIP